MSTGEKTLVENINKSAVALYFSVFMTSYFFLADLFYYFNINFQYSYLLYPPIEGGDGLRFLSTLLLFLMLSLLLERNCLKNKFDYWGYISVASFSVFGSLIVAGITSKTLSPCLLAIAVALLHSGWWSWQKEFERRKTHDAAISDNIDNIVSTANSLYNKDSEMPEKQVYRILTLIYVDIRPPLVAIYRKILPQLSDGKQVTPDTVEKTTKEINEYLSTILSALCSIAENWTSNSEEHFEANIMILRPSNNIAWSKFTDESLENGECFFPSKPTRATIEDICEAVLFIDSSISSQSKKKNMNPNTPLALPVDMINENGAIPGAPTACESRDDTCIADVKHEFEQLDILTSTKRKQMLEYFALHFECESITSLRIPPYLGLDADDPVSAKYGCIGIVNLYSTGKGGVKSLRLLKQFCTPLLYFVSDFIFYKESLAMGLKEG